LFILYICIANHKEPWINPNENKTALFLLNFLKQKWKGKNLISQVLRESHLDNDIGNSEIGTGRIWMLYKTATYRYHRVIFHILQNKGGFIIIRRIIIPWKF
jgi:hypothetical protein